MVDFSIVVPVYNVEKYIRRCVDSLLQQTEQNFEILLVDDGSKDSSGRICEEYAKQDTRVRVFHKENGGLSSARNYGINRAEGTYVLFVDSDDYVEQDLLSGLKDALQKCRGVDALIYGGLEESDTRVIRNLRNVEPSKAKIWNVSSYMCESYQHRNLNIQAWLYAYRRDFLNENHLRFKEGILHEDVEFTPRALLKAEKIAEVPGNFYHYMVREGSISTGKNQEKNIQDLFQTLSEQCELANQQEPELKKWMLDAILNSYFNMIYEARMYRPEYRRYVDKSFLCGKAATSWNRVRVLLCLISVRLYCMVNDAYKKLRG